MVIANYVIMCSYFLNGDVVFGLFCVKENSCNEKFIWVVMLGGWLAGMVCDEVCVVCTICENVGFSGKVLNG